jgi:hypothetical protein
MAPKPTVGWIDQAAAPSGSESPTDSIDQRTPPRLDGVLGSSPDGSSRAEDVRGLRDTVGTELESQRREQDKLRAEIEDCGAILNASRKIMSFDPALLRDAIGVGLELAGAQWWRSTTSPRPCGSAPASARWSRS